MGRFRRRAAASTPAPSSGGNKDSGQDSSGVSPTESRRRRHAVFYDVENTSSADDVSDVMSKLTMDRAECDTHLVAVGNWRVIGQQTARLLARQGAELIHSAPSTGVRDWSDLRIAVDAGIWLGTARPGDILHIVSDDQAFDAVGDVAATLGVQFSRIKTRERRASQRAADSSRTIRSRQPAAAPHTASRQQAAAVPHTASRQQAAAVPHTASHEELLAIVKRLTANGSSPDGTTLDVLSNELKNAGFGRAPGSLRLITRLKRMKEIQVGTDGSIQLVAPEKEIQPPRSDSGTEGTETPRKRTRRGRRGGRRRSGRQRSSAGSTSPATVKAAPQESVELEESAPITF